MVKSPLNYIGNKYKLLPQIIPLFPSNINTFVDLFCGGGDVCANVVANTVRANDINFHVIELFETFQYNSIILDNCMGSGSTGVACKNLNRDFIGIELDENYFQIAKERIN